MTWRAVQLGDTLCQQDQIIIDLFQDQRVRYIGNDSNFSKHLNCHNIASNLVLVINEPIWISKILEICKQHLTSDINCFYLSINRYTVLGNDTNFIAHNFIELLEKIVNACGFTVAQSGRIDRDLGRYFNFVQPLTWIYGNQITN